MKLFKRWTTTFVSGLDNAITRVENHEALISSAIHDMQHSAAKAQAQLRRVQKDGRDMQKRIGELREQAVLWKERAKKSAELDQEKAFECLRRAKSAERQLSDLSQQEKDHSEVEKKLAADLQTVTARIETLTRERNLMRTRESRAKAYQAVKKAAPTLGEEIEEIFERWETQLGAKEWGCHFSPSNTDKLEEEFSEGEEKEALAAELEQLLAEKSA